MGVLIRQVLCLDLPTAGLIIGYLGVFGAILETIEILLSFVYFDDDGYNVEYYTEKLFGPESTTIAHFITCLMLVVCLLDFLASILLIRGTNKKSQRMLLPWLIIQGIGLTILFLATSLCLIVGIYCIFSGQGSFLLVNSVLVLILLVIYSYIFMVIYSLYHFIRDEIQKPHQIDAEISYSNILI